MIGAQLCQATPRTLFPPWWGYRAGTCAVPNPTKFFARSVGRGSLRHTPPTRSVVRWCLDAVKKVEAKAQAEREANKRAREDARRRAKARADQDEGQKPAPAAPGEKSVVNRYT